MDAIDQSDGTIRWLAEGYVPCQLSFDLHKNPLNQQTYGEERLVPFLFMLWEYLRSSASSGTCTLGLVLMIQREGSPC